MQTRAMAGDLTANGGQNGAATGALAARLLAGNDGARIAVIETGGWDTHANQRGRLGFQLRGLDGLIGALKTGLGADWANTLVLVATEFGRTAAPNGTGGTDHGTASLAMLLGGAVAGGRVVADWPGPRPGRPLRRPRPQADHRSRHADRQRGRRSITGSIPPRPGRTLFPNIGNARPLERLDPRLRRRFKSAAASSRAAPSRSFGRDPVTLYARFAAHLDAVLDALEAEGALAPGIERGAVAVEPPRDPAHGDLATNAAMVLAKRAGTNPRALAEAIAPKLAALDEVAGAEMAGPGFINIRLDRSVWEEELAAILADGDGYGRSDMGAGRTVNVEYVSANPTGPMHMGHCRGAVVGDALASLLEYAGHEVIREYYVNDAGAQVDVLARSAHLRYLRGARPPDRRDPRRPLSRRLSEAGRRSARRRIWRRLCRRARERLAGDLPPPDGRGDARADQGGPRRRSASTTICSPPKPRCSNRARSTARSRCSTRRAWSTTARLPPPKGKTRRGLGAGRAARCSARPQFGDDQDRPIRKIGRQLDLFRRRHRLSHAEARSRPTS